MARQISFAFKLTAALGTLSVCAIAATGFLGFELVMGREEAKEATVARGADGIADKIERNLFERYGDVQAFAMSESARSGDRGRIESFMVDMMGAYAPVYDVMMVLDREGKVIAANTVDKSGKPLNTTLLYTKNFKNEDWFIASVSGQVPAGKAHFTDMRVDTVTAEFTATNGKVMMFTSPIRDPKSGEILGVWTNRMSWTDVVEDIVFKEAAKLVDEQAPIVSARLIAEDGTYLVHKDANKVLQAKHSIPGGYSVKERRNFAHALLDDEDISADAVEAIAPNLGFSSYPGKNWSVVLRTPLVDSHIRNAQLVGVGSVALILFLSALSLIVALRTSRSLGTIIYTLQAGAKQVGDTSLDVTKASHGLSEASAEQASALQETAASIEEINAMIKRSSENATRSQEVAMQSSGIAKQGKDSVDQMSEAIKEINISNEAILKQISDSNAQISDIARVISNIGLKTKVINDIVFQTKLLSFNASVEAARAGEHGKGFAVVAEEVGNLAQMSGNAAKEISEMLADSTKSVERIVEDTKLKVERLIADGRQKVQSGMVIADKCGKVLVEVVHNVEELNSMVAEIAVASREQSQGVNEITKAMNELDQTTHANATTSQQASGYATSLQHESERLANVVSELVMIVKGSAKMPVEQVATEPTGPTAKIYEFPQKTEKTAVKLRKVSGDSTPDAQDPRFKDV